MRPSGVELLTEASDETLFNETRNGNNRAFDEFMRRHRSRVIRIARGMVADDDDAQELAQDAFMKAYGSIRRFKGDCSPRTWIDRIVVNGCIDWQRRQKLRRGLLVFIRRDEEDRSMEEAVPEQSWESDPLTVCQGKDIRSRIDGVLGTLPPRQRAAFVLRHWEGLSMREIAETLDCAEGTAKVHLHRATERMREILLPYREDV